MNKATRWSSAIIFSWIVVAPAYCYAAPHDVNNTGWFKSTLQTMHDAIATGDKSVWERVLASDFIMTTEDGTVLDRRQFLAGLTPLPQGFSGVQKIQKLTVHEWGSTAVAHFWVYERENTYDQVLKTTYIETDTFRREKGAWKMIAAQVTVVPRNLKGVKVDTRNWPALEGKYGLNGRASWPYVVFSRNGSLYGGRNRKSATELIALSPLVYYQKGTIHIMVFVKNSAGAIDEVLQLHKYNEVVFRRISEKHSR